MNHIHVDKKQSKGFYFAHLSPYHAIRERPFQFSHQILRLSPVHMNCLANGMDTRIKYHQLACIIFIHNFPVELSAGAVIHLPVVIVIRIQTLKKGWMLKGSLVVWSINFYSPHAVYILRLHWQNVRTINLSIHGTALGNTFRHYPIVSKRKR